MVSHDTTLRIVYGVWAFILLAWGIVQIILTFTSPCAFRFTTSNDFRDGGGSDDVGWQAPTLGTPTPNQFSASLLLGIAMTVEGFYLAIISWLTGAWEQHWEEIVVKSNRQRWIRWGLTDAVYYAVVAYTAGVTNNALISAYAVAAIGLNFAQAYNETVNSGVIDQETGAVTIAGGATSAANPWENVPRIDGWIVATLIFAWAAVVWYVYLASGTQAGISPAVFAIPIVWGGVYLILHLLIIGALTNYQLFGAKAWTYRREYAFIVFRFLLLAYTTIVLAFVQNAPSCPT